MGGKWMGLVVCEKPTYWEYEVFASLNRSMSDLGWHEVNCAAIPGPQVRGTGGSHKVIETPMRPGPPAK